MGLSIEKHGYTGWVMPVTPVPAYTSRDSTTKHGRRHVRGHPNLVCPILMHDFFSKTTHAVQERDPCPKKDKAAMSLKQRYMYHIYKAIAKNPKLTPWLISIIRVIKVHFFNSQEMQMYFHTLCPFTFEGFAVCTGLTGNLLKTPTPCRPLHYQTWLTAGMLNLIHIYPVFLANPCHFHLYTLLHPLNLVHPSGIGETGTRRFVPVGVSFQGQRTTKPEQPHATHILCIFETAATDGHWATTQSSAGPHKERKKRHTTPMSLQVLEKTWPGGNKDTKTANPAPWVQGTSARAFLENGSWHWSIKVIRLSDQGVRRDIGTGWGWGWRS